jgi:hypothetical protein
LLFGKWLYDHIGEEFLPRKKREKVLQRLGYE